MRTPKRTGAPHTSATVRKRHTAAAAEHAAAAARLKVELATDRYGTLMPSIAYHGTDHEHYREVRAVLLEIAAAVELASIPTREGWVVQVERTGDFSGRVHLELINGSRDEAAAGMQVLTDVAARRRA